MRTARMVIGVLQFELLIHGAESLKDKRRVVKSLKDRLHREHMVSVAEVASHDNPSRAVLGLAGVARDGAAGARLLDAVLLKLRALTDAELGDVSREILHGAQLWQAPGESGSTRGDEAGDPGDVVRAMLAGLGEPPREPPVDPRDQCRHPA